MEKPSTQSSGISLGAIYVGLPGGRVLSQIREEEAKESADSIKKDGGRVIKPKIRGSS